MKIKLTKCEAKKSQLENNITKLNHDNSAVRKLGNNSKDEIEKLKRYYDTKLNEQLHNINKLTTENQRLKKMFGQDIGNKY